MDPRPGKTITIDVDPLDTIDHVKDLIFEREGIPPVQQHLTCNGQVLKSDRTLESYSILKESTLSLQLPRYGGGCVLAEDSRHDYHQHAIKIKVDMRVY